jgi:hypothetical protein
LPKSSAWELSGGPAGAVFRFLTGCFPLSVFVGVRVARFDRVTPSRAWRFLPMYFLTIRGGAPIAEDRTMSGATERTGSFASLPDWPLLIPYP